MSFDQIPEALAQDVREHLISADPAAVLADPEHVLPLTEDNVRLRHAKGEPPSPRVVVLSGTARRFPGMDTTARVPISVEFIESQDRSTEESHRERAKALSGWFHGLRAERGQQDLFTRTFMHDLLVQHPSSGIRTTERERVTVLRGDFIATLRDTV